MNSLIFKSTSSNVGKHCVNEDPLNPNHTEVFFALIYVRSNLEKSHFHTLMTRKMTIMIFLLDQKYANHNRTFGLLQHLICFCLGGSKIYPHFQLLLVSYDFNNYGGVTRITDDEEHGAW